MQENIAAFQALGANHYTYYKFHSGMLIAVLWAYTLRRAHVGWLTSIGWIELFVLLLIVVFFLGSRDNLQKYYTRTSDLLSANRPN